MGEYGAVWSVGEYGAVWSVGPCEVWGQCSVRLCVGWVSADCGGSLECVVRGSVESVRECVSYHPQFDTALNSCITYLAQPQENLSALITTLSQVISLLSSAAVVNVSYLPI